MSIVGDPKRCSEGYTKCHKEKKSDVARWHFPDLGDTFIQKKQITSEEQAVLCVSNQPYVSLTGRKLMFEGEENCQEEAVHNKNKMQFLCLRTETRNKMKMNLRFDSEYLLCCRLLQSASQFKSDSWSSSDVVQ